MIAKAYKRVCLAMALTTLSAFAQQSIGAGSKAEPWNCHSVALSADNPALPYRLFAPYLEKQKAFQAQGFQLSDEPLTADVFVHVSEGEVGSTRIVVVNRRTHESRSAATSWTEYPGMVATDVMSEVGLVCRPPAVLVARSVAPTPLPESSSSPGSAHRPGNRAEARPRLQACNGSDCLLHRPRPHRSRLYSGIHRLRDCPVDGSSG